MKNSLTFLIILFCNPIIAQSPTNKETDNTESCVEKFQYGQKSENYIDFQVENESRRLYFSNVDVYHNDKGGYNIYLPPFGFDASIHDAILEEAEKQTLLANIFTNNTPQLSEIHLAWTPESTFSSDRMSVLKEGLLAGDCFFAKHKKKIKTLFEDISYNFKIDTTKTDDGLIFKLTASKEENKSTMELHLKIKEVKKTPKFSEESLEEAYDLCSSGKKIQTTMYHYAAEDILKFKTRRSFNYKVLKLNGAKSKRIGNPGTGEFSIFEFTELDNSSIIIREYLMNKKEEKDVGNAFPVFFEPLQEAPKEINEYELKEDNLENCYISSSLIKITGEPLIISEEMLPQNSELHDYISQSKKAKKTTIEPKFNREIAFNELPEKQMITSTPDEYYSYWMEGSNGNLYKINAKEENNSIQYDFYEYPIPEEVFFLHLKNKFPSDEAYMAYAELLLIGEQAVESATFGDEDALRWIKNKLETAGLEELISEKTGEMIMSIGNYIDSNFTEKEKQYIALYYLKNTNNGLEIINGYINAEKYLEKDNFNEEEFLNFIQLGLNQFNINTKDQKNTKILKTLKDSITVNYGRKTIYILEQIKQNEQLISTLQIDKNNGNVISLNKELGKDLSLFANYRKDSLALETKGSKESKSTAYKVTENIWDAHQLYSSLPFLPLKKGYEETIYLVDYTNFFTYGTGSPIPHIKTKIGLVNLNVLDTKKIKIAGKKQRVYELEMTLANKLKGIPGISKNAEEYKVKEDGSVYATIYMDKSYPHQLYTIELKNKKINFMKEGNYELSDWYGKILSE